MADTEKNNKKLDTGYVLIKDWCEENSLSYSDTLKVLRKLKKPIGKFGNAKTMKLDDLKDTFIQEVKNQENKFQETSAKRSETVKKRSSIISWALGKEIDGWDLAKIDLILEKIKDEKFNQGFLRDIGINYDPSTGKVSSIIK